jgi:hypothetical protein
MAFKDMELHMDNDFLVDLHEISGLPVSFLGLQVALLELINELFKKKNMF